MATLVLTVAGGAIGGPIGAAIGAALGRSVDRELFGGDRREGPRLTELSVQTSSYGTAIPRLFGTMRVAGTVIWSTDLIEARSVEGGGKGSPETTRYSYSASFAVLLSARAIRGVRRIWADGKLLRGAAGDFKSRVAGFRIHTGSDDQAADPLLASLETGGTPAYRGAAYVVFEELQLADFGNRIPSLTFEVEADAGAVGIADIAAAVSEGLVSGAGGRAVGGFSAYGSSRRAVIETLARIGGGWFAPAGDTIALRHGTGAAETIADSGQHHAGEPAARGVRSLSVAPAPTLVSISHYDPARDYQAGIQRAVRPGRDGAALTIDLPAALSAAAAKAVAEATMASTERDRERRKVALGWDRLALTPGARVAIAGEAGQWRVARWSFETMVLTLDLVRIVPAPLATAASSGRVLAAPDREAGRTIVAPFELPLIGDTLRTTPALAIAAAGEGDGWRNAALVLSEDGGASWRAIGGTALPAMIGTVATPPGRSPAGLVDRHHVVEVELASAAMVLPCGDAAALDAGANLAMLGDELIQFGTAEQVGERRWRIADLWRGRRGTEAAMGAQRAGDRFVLLSADTLATADLAAATLGGEAIVQASGVGDTPEPATAEAAISGRSVLPPPPVHLTARTAPDGALQLEWVRRSRLGWRWIDGADAPLAEESECYAVRVEAASGAVRTYQTQAPMLTVPPFEPGEAPASVAVRQIGANGLSLPATMTLSSNNGAGQ